MKNVGGECPSLRFTTVDKARIGSSHSKHQSHLTTAEIYDSQPRSTMISRAMRKVSAQIPVTPRLSATVDVTYGSPEKNEGRYCLL